VFLRNLWVVDPLKELAADLGVTLPAWRSG
jgi:hypothetical protein